MPVTFNKGKTLPGEENRPTAIDVQDRSTGIEWTDVTWNPFVGCSIHSPGCTNCYAMRQAADIVTKNPRTLHYHGVTKVVNGHPVWTGKLNLAPQHILNKPSKVKRPSMFFVNSMSDFFHEDAPFAWQALAMNIMAANPHHVFQILTKRSERIKPFFDKWGACPNHVWLGVTVETGKYMDRIVQLIATPCAVHFLSLEPLIGSLAGLGKYLGDVEWAILGGESGHGARSMNVEWVREGRDACVSKGVPFFFKQYGVPRNNPLWSAAERAGIAPLNHVRDNDPVGKGGSLIDGRAWKQFPVTGA